MSSQEAIGSYEFTPLSSLVPFSYSFWITTSIITTLSKDQILIKILPFITVQGGKIYIQAAVLSWREMILSIQSCA